MVLESTSIVYKYRLVSSEMCLQLRQKGLDSPLSNKETAGSESRVPHSTGEAANFCRLAIFFPQNKRILLRGTFRNLHWRYLTYVRSKCKVCLSKACVREYPPKISEEIVTVQYLHFGYLNVPLNFGGSPYLSARGSPPGLAVGGTKIPGYGTRISYEVSYRVLDKFSYTSSLH
jgi:hypothetical protein